MYLFIYTKLKCCNLHYIYLIHFICYILIFHIFKYYNIIMFHSLAELLFHPFDYYHLFLVVRTFDLDLV